MQITHEALIESFIASEAPKFCVADNKTYHKDNAEFLKQINYITLVPSSIKLERESIAGALLKNQWVAINENYKYASINSETLSVEHMGITQRWLVVYSKAANERAKKSITGLVTKERKALAKAPFLLTSPAVRL